MELQVAIVTAGFAGMGLAALARPRAIGNFFDVKFESVDGRNEVRAVYGGFGIAMALALFLSSTRPALHDGVILCVCLALAGMAAGRLFSVLLERPGFWPWFFCGVESVAAIALWSVLG
jgi:hypothetical protein